MNINLDSLILENEFPSNLKAASDFCPECGNILELPLYTDFIECASCDYKCHILSKNIIQSLK